MKDERTWSVAPIDDVGLSNGGGFVGHNGLCVEIVRASRNWRKTRLRSVGLRTQAGLYMFFKASNVYKA